MSSSNVTQAAKDAGEFAIASVTIASEWTNVAVVDVRHRDGLICFDLLVGTAALTALRVTRSGVNGGHAAGSDVVIAADADLDTPSFSIPSVLPASAYQATATTRVQIVVDTMGAAEIGIDAKSGGTATLAGVVRVPG